MTFLGAMYVLPLERMAHAEVYRLTVVVVVKVALSKHSALVSLTEQRTE